MMDRSGLFLQLFRQQSSLSFESCTVTTVRTQNAADWNKKQQEKENLNHLNSSQWKLGRNRLSLRWKIHLKPPINSSFSSLSSTSNSKYCDNFTWYYVPNIPLPDPCSSSSSWGHLEFECPVCSSAALHTGDMLSAAASNQWVTLLRVLHQETFRGTRSLNIETALIENKWEMFSSWNSKAFRLQVSSSGSLHAVSSAGEQHAEFMNDVWEGKSVTPAFTLVVADWIGAGWCQSPIKYFSHSNQL